ncbi:MAG: pentapeptide repeat-containing protein [Streptosporangiaceae bacterium]
MDLRLVQQTERNGGHSGAVTTGTPAPDRQRRVRPAGTKLNTRPAVSCLGGCSGAKLSDPKFGDVTLTGADLTGADLTGARWSSAVPAPEGWKLHTGRKLHIGTGRLVAAVSDSAATEAN